MARTEVFIKDEDGEAQLWRTDLTGRGVVHEGEEFTIRQVSQYGANNLVPNGIRRRVRVRSVGRHSGSLHVLTVDDIRDDPQVALFT